MKTLQRILLVTFTLLLLVPATAGQEKVVRVASYNIKFLSDAVTGQGDRRAKLLDVINQLEADVIGLQEIKDRAARREEVVIASSASTSINLSGWKLRDASAHVFPLSGTVSAGGTRTIVMTSNSMPLTNSGDEISLLDPQGNVRHIVTYSGLQAKPGQVVVFP